MTASTLAGSERERAPRSFSHPQTSERVVSLLGPLAGRQVLDVGAGEGYLASLIGARAARDGLAPDAVVTACDLNPEQFRYRAVTCQRIDANGRLPFADASFDVACSIEVVEHLEDQFAFARELARVVKPGGRAIVTTPNTHNLNGRVRQLACGFPPLYNPLPLDDRGPAGAIHASSGHIHPVSPYYLAYQMRRAGFARVMLHGDRVKRSAVGLGLALLPVVLVGRWALARRLRLRHPEIFAQNAELISAINSWRMLTARTTIAEAWEAGLTLSPLGGRDRCLPGRRFPASSPPSDR